MDIIATATLGFVALGSLIVIMIVLAWPRRRRMSATRFVARSRLKGAPAARGSTNWFAGDAVLFTGSDAGSADCSAGGDGGGGGGGGGGCD